LFASKILILWCEKKCLKQKKREKENSKEKKYSTVKTDRQTFLIQTWEF
jgi:hypothetical protein